MVVPNTEIITRMANEVANCWQSLILFLTTRSGLNMFIIGPALFTSFYFMSHLPNPDTALYTGLFITAWVGQMQWQEYETMVSNMPLYIRGVQVQKVLSVDTFFDEHAHFKESSQFLLNQEVRIVGPENLLYIGQREVAGTSPSDEKVSLLGSEDATTCHIAVLRHTGSGATSLIHFDGCSTLDGLKSMVSIVTDLTEDMSSGRLEFHLVGGFDDDKRNSHEVSNKIFMALYECSEDIHLVTACITNVNTYKYNNIPFPVIYGLAVDVKTGELYRATFPDKGPDLSLRSARHFTGGKENIEIYDHRKCEMVIGPFHYGTLSDVDIYLTLPNQLIRKYLSTSPEQEPDGFEESTRASLLQIRDFPDPLKSVFKGGRPRRYRKDNTSGLWVMIE